MKHSAGDAAAPGVRREPDRASGDPARGRVALRLAAYSAFGLAGLALFARQTVASRLDAIPGNIGDARFVLYVCEHWHHVFAGAAPWLDPPILYPTQGVLGYSEALFALGAAHSLLRHLGLDAFAAYQVVVLSLPPLGYAGAVWLLRRGFGVGPAAATLGALLFAYSSPMATSMVHAQLEAVAFVPFLALFLLDALANLGSRDRRGVATGLGFAVGFPLLAYTCFYIAWFCVLFAAIAILLAAGWCAATRRWDVPRAWLRAARTGWRRLAVFAAVLAVSSVPFVVTYAPALRAFPRRPYVEEVLPGLPSPIDLVNVGFDNAVWGSLLRKIAPGLQVRPLFWELDKGIAPVLLALFAAVSILAWRRRSGAAPAAPRASVVPVAHARTAVLVCAAAVAVAWVLMLKSGSRSVWWLVYRGFPGGGAVRGPFRFDILLMLPIAVVAAYGVDRALARLRARSGAAASLALAALGAVLVAEQHNLHPDVLSKRAERAELAGVPQPPPGCRSMVVTADVDRYDGWWAPLNLHAILVSSRFRIPTVNGYSGWTPPTWDLHFPTKPGYRERVRKWASDNGVLDGLCEYHVDTRTWRPFAAARVQAPDAAAIPSSRDR